MDSLTPYSIDQVAYQLHITNIILTLIFAAMVAIIVLIIVAFFVFRRKDKRNESLQNKN